jgi:hypothetical protein
VLLELDHGAKPNWIVYKSARTGLPGPHFFVADTTSCVSAYTFVA